LLAALEDQQREGEAFELNGEVLAVDSVKVMPFIENLQSRVRIKIPRNTWIKNDDMRIELAGDVELVKHSETVELFGSVDVVRGQYDLLGKVFVVQEGKIGFEGGDKINPSLQVVAVYSFRDTEKNKRELSIDVSGYADAPVLSFQLDGTTVDEGNALSYMLFGKDLDALSSSDRSNVDQGASTLQLAQSAALSLLSSQLTNVLGKAFQVDYVEYKSGSTLGEGSFVVGKYVTNNLFVSYERNFGEAAQEEQLVEYEMRMEYELFRFLFLQLTSAPTRNGFDVIFKF
ncbi:MAG: translocation/assembly module TamB domain-containing protein, partial [Bacteroidales bacterium]|nr:translocation/assembly module TamB domain-containing protein [Bacteroidales bacterium]